MPTAFVTDARFAAHTLPGHPEHAGRLAAVVERLEAARLLERFVRVTARPAADEELLAVHSASHLARLEATAGRPPAMLGLDTYVTGESYAAARLAAGAVIEVIGGVLRGEAANGIAAIRPPGHHATPAAAMGFCLLNNAAIGARAAQQTYGVGRVLIVDYDVHHGNGTQDVFYSDPSVLYISTHQSPLYPGTGMIQETGQGEGRGATLNIPLPPGTGDQGYVRVFEDVVGPAAVRFQPELILVSAGFDAHWADPLAQMRLSLTGYDRLTRHLLSLADALCGGRIVFVMEGGYHLPALSHAWANVAAALLGEAEARDPLGPAPASEPVLDALIDRVRQLHKLD